MIGFLLIGLAITLLTIAVTLTAIVTGEYYQRSKRRAELRAKLDRRLREMGFPS